MFKKDVVADAVIILLILATLPFIALLLFALRGVLVGALIVALILGPLAYVFSPAFRDWFSAWAEPLIRYKGLRLATDVGLDPSHSWARVDEDGSVGVDDLVQATLGPVDAVELPPTGRHVQRGEPLFRLRHGDRIIDVPSPVSGTVIEVNPALLDHPDLINDAPFDSGWAVRIRSDDPRSDRRALLRGKKARAWFRSTADEVLQVSRNRAGVLTGAGVGVEQLYRQIDTNTWHDLIEPMFTARRDE